jgi:hypothetical protein
MLVIRQSARAGADKEMAEEASMPLISTCTANVARSLL